MADEQKFTIEEITPRDLPEKIGALINASAGRLLRFRNAVLARAEVNKNNDEISEEGLAEVAATLPLLAIDVEHNAQQVVGYYTDARSNGKLATDGVIFADRFPNVAQGILDGSYRLSIEATAKEATCSVCGTAFAHERDYCDHLTSRKTTGAVRKLKGLRAVGGAVTRSPAGSQTEFDPSQITLLASITQPDSSESEGAAEEEVLSFVTESEFDLWRSSPAQFNAVVAKTLEYQERKKLSTESFALIQKRKGESGKTLVRRRFPVQDCAHARNALARLPNAQDLSDEERAQVKRKAEAKLNSEECLREAPSRKERKENAARAAQRLFSQFGNVDLIQYNPRGYTSLSSPVLSPFLYMPPDPDWVKQVAAKAPGSKSKPMAQPSVGAAATPDVKLDIEALRKELVDRIAQLESKIEGSASDEEGKGSGGRGVIGIAWEIPKTKLDNDKIELKW